MASARPIIGAFQDIGENVVEQVKQLPQDMVGQALESVGVTMGGSQKGNKQSGSPVLPGGTDQEGSAYKKLDTEADQKIKKEIARNALKELIQTKSQKDPSVWERLQQEEAQKKDMQKQQQIKQASELPMPKGKSKQGAMGKVNKSKQQGNEMKINMKQD